MFIESLQSYNSCQDAESTIKLAAKWDGVEVRTGENGMGLIATRKPSKEVAYCVLVYIQPCCMHPDSELLASLSPCRAIDRTHNSTLGLLTDRAESLDILLECRGIDLYLPDWFGHDRSPRDTIRSPRN